MNRVALTTFTVLATACLSAFQSMPAAGGVVFLGGSRQVSTRMSGGGMQIDAAPATTGSWSGSATSLAPGSAMARVTASQSSTVTATSINGSGTISYTRLMQDTTTGEGRSIIDYFLRVDQPTDFTLVGNVAEGTNSSIILQGNNGFMLSGTTVNQTGTLPTGVYEFSATMVLSVPQLGPGSAAWNVMFIVPSPGGGGVVLLGLIGQVVFRRRRKVYRDASRLATGGHA